MIAQTHQLPYSGNIHRTVLDNGIVLLIHTLTHVRSVVIAGSVRAGALYEQPAQNGLASLTAEALMRGTQSHDFDAIFSALEDIGADLSFGTGHHQVGFGGKALAEDLPLLVELLNDTLRYPTFPERQLENLMIQRITELRYSQQDNRYRAEEAFRKHLYPPEHPYHYSSYGTIDTLQTLSPADLKAFHKKHYGPAGMLLAVVGNVEPEEVVELIQESLGGWRNDLQPDEVDLPELIAPEKQQRINVVLPGKTQSAIVMGTIGPSSFAEDYRAALLANSVLGEFGMMGRLGQVIREDMGLAYYAHSRLDGGVGPGAWSISAGVAPDKVDVTIEAAIHQVNQMRETLISEDDLEDNLSYYTGSLPLRLESAGGIANQLIAMERYNLGLDFLVNYRELMYRFTRDDIQSAMLRYLDPERFVISVAGPSA
ncbi:MAG: insulinase family protein [Anaerolineae bacterium]|nr:insulinase family protein [Anaerolineae bacterium]